MAKTVPGGHYKRLFRSIRRIRNCWLKQDTQHTTSTYDDVTHVSLAELAHSIGDYGQHMGHEFITLIGSLNGVVVIGMGSMSLDGVTIPEGTLDSVATAVQTSDGVVVVEKKERT